MKKFKLLIIAISLSIYGCDISTMKDKRRDSVAVNRPLSKTYTDLREKMFSVTPAMLQVQTDPSKEKAYGVIFETNGDQGIATAVSFITGDASLYTSTGGGIIGGITHDNVKEAAIKLVNSGQQFINNLPVDSGIALPKAGNIKIFILTDQHRYSVEVASKELTNTSSTYADLFYYANDLITQLRLTTERK